MVNTPYHCSEPAATLAARQRQPANAWRNEAREILAPSLLIWSQARFSCAIAPCCCARHGTDLGNYPGDQYLLSTRNRRKQFYNGDFAP